jgi:hypothetical protein
MGYRKRKGKEYYYIHWKGYPTEDDSCEPKENLSKATLEVWERRAQEKGPRRARRRKGTIE